LLFSSTPEYVRASEVLSERGIFRLENHASPYEATPVSLLKGATEAGEDCNVRVGRANPWDPFLSSKPLSLLRFSSHSQAGKQAPALSMVHTAATSRLLRV
jgi:hypothetical protein